MPPPRCSPPLLSQTKEPQRQAISSVQIRFEIRTLCSSPIAHLPDQFFAVEPMALRDENCIPCHEGGGMLSDEDLESLRQELPDWEVMDHHHLHKRLSFPDFATAVGWLTCAAAICEQQGHHADFRVGWGYVEIDIHTHKVNGLTRADAVLAAKFDAMTS